MTRAYRYLAPRVLRTDHAGSDLGWANWAMAFTTTCSNRLDAKTSESHLHRCGFKSLDQAPYDAGPIHWRVESQPLGIASPAALRVVEGEARNLDAARDAALEAVLRPNRNHGAEFEVRFGPAFVALPVLPRHPRVWGCAAAVLPADDDTGTAQQPVERLCFIRERLGVSRRFLGTLERHEAASALLEHWVRQDVSEAAEVGCHVLLGGKVSQVEGG